jgi:hypothetical protein
MVLILFSLLLHRRAAVLEPSDLSHPQVQMVDRAAAVHNHP